MPVWRSLDMKLRILLFLIGGLCFVQPTFAQKVDCGCETAPLPDVLVIVNGTRLKAADVFSDSTQKKVGELQKSVIDERKNELQLLISSRLLEAEARKRGMSPTRLVKQEVTLKVADPTDTEVEEFYNRNRASISGDLSAARGEIIAYIRNKRETAASESFAGRLRAAADVKELVDAATPPANAAERSRVFATINGVAIRSGDVEDMLRPTIFSVQEQVYALRKAEIETQINDMLLTAEAKRRGVTTTQLYDAEVDHKARAVTDADARGFYDKNRERINGEFEKVKLQLIQYLVDQSKKNAEETFAARLRSAASIQLFLPEPVPPLYAIDTAGRPSKGSQNAPVTVVEFIDIECRTCSEPYHAVDRIFNEMNGRLRLVVMHYPLSQHKHAQKAAEAAEAARDQGKFWEYVDLLFKNQTALEPTDLKQYATQLGLDRKKFDAALDGTRLSDNVDHDRLEGDKLGINRTPTVYINGRRSADVTYEGLKTAVEAAMKNNR
jgi:protein-disulfide isomerase